MEKRKVLRIGGGILANFDGKDVAVKGNPDYDMTSAKRVNANTIQFTRKKGGKVVQTATSVVAADGKTRTVTTTGVNAADAYKQRTAHRARQAMKRVS